MEEFMNLPPEKILLRWMNFHLKKAGYKKIVTNFSSDVKVIEFLIWWKVNVLIFYHLLWTTRITVHSVLSQCKSCVSFTSSRIIIWSFDPWSEDTSLVWSLVMAECFGCQHFPNTCSTHVEHTTHYLSN